ncbi:hypothetical protein SUGI_1139160 [Cryptomeria japonica]|nr:hypothetical protein SUGI_1139160 [Cryptomeria japonica]
MYTEYLAVPDKYIYSPNATVGEQLGKVGWISKDGMPVRPVLKEARSSLCGDSGKIVDVGHLNITDRKDGNLNSIGSDEESIKDMLEDKEDITD